MDSMDTTKEEGIMEDTCESCRFWVGGEPGLGLCRRYAPRPNPESTEIYWPTTAEYEWCGEYSAKAQQPDEAS